MMDREPPVESGTAAQTQYTSQPVRIFVGAHATEKLPLKVLEYSIRRHTALDITVETIDNTLVPVPGDPRFLPYTNFSYGRFAIPKLAGYEGRAIYMDSDMVVFGDIAEIWEMPFDGAKILVEEVTGQTRGSGRLTAVMVMDCEALRWEPADIVSRLGVDYDYTALMSILPLLDEGDLQDRLPVGWNSLDEYTNATRLLHYTKIKTQPWVYPAHPLGFLWIDEVRRMLADGSLSAEMIEDEVAQGHVRPSLLPELGLSGHTDPNAWTAEKLTRFDKRSRFVIHEKLIADMNAKQRARLEHERETDPDRYWRERRKRMWRNFYRHPVSFFTQEKLRW
jgi:hypothetical protein